MRKDFEALLVIGGYPRSGTSMIRNVLNKHPAVYCVNEIPIKFTYPMVIKSLRAFRWRAERIGRRRFLNQRILRLVAEQWFALSMFKEDRAGFRSAQVIGNKTPGSERFFSDYEYILPKATVRYVYCWRDPVKVMRSNLNMLWSGQNFDYTFAKLIDSYKHFLEVKDELGDCIYLFNLERFSETPREIVGELCRFINVSLDFVDMMADLPPANTMLDRSRHAEVRELTDKEIHRIDTDPVVVRMKRSTYSTASLHSL